VSVRSYGEFTERSGSNREVQATVPGLQGKVHPSYPPFDLTIPDGVRLDVWLDEFRTFEQRGGLPRLNIIRLGNDHTLGTTPGRPTPRAMVAENDVALGRLVAAISSSRYWNESAIFIVEDDAQNGPDHVDSHRSVALAISPFVRRQAVDSTLYTTSSVLRTMELILGLPPMSQYDAAATPMYNAFQATARVSPVGIRADSARREERRRRLRRSGVAGHEFRRGRHDARVRVERDHLALGARRPLANAASRACRIHPGHRCRRRARGLQ
jgi:hypothetical protein